MAQKLPTPKPPLLAGWPPSLRFASLRWLVLVCMIVAAAFVPGCGASDDASLGGPEEDINEVAEEITAGTNLALNKPASSSSVYGGAGASRVVDGSTDGNWGSGSVAHTANDINPWVQVDLQSSVFIGTVILWARTDCCSDRLSNLRVRVSDDASTWQDLLYPGTVAKQATFAINKSARYVRVQLEGTSPRYMNIAELQVFGPPNLAQGKTATQSSEAAGGVASRAVDGNTDGNFVNVSVTHTYADYQAWWKVDLGAPQNVGVVELYNRTDCCAERLSNFKLLVSENGTDWSSWAYPGIAGPKTTFVVNRAARWVKVQLVGTNYLSLAEVRVYPAANAAISAGGAGAVPLGSYPTSPVGAVNGDFSVDAQGAATYSVPIKVPPGTHGVEPKLSLSYRSGGSNGFVGVGWSLGGIPFVTRCPRTKAQDGVRGGVNGDANDRFCLDGQRLIAISGVYGANGTEYRTEIDSFSRVYSYGTCGTGPCRFEVTDKTGNLAIFGETNMVATFDGQTPRMYALNKLKDPNGNYLFATYVWDAGQIYPVGIKYTLNDAAPSLKTRSVNIIYDDRPDKEFAYVGGAKVPTSKRISSIKTYITTAQGDELVREYRLGYTTSGLSKRSLLNTLTECDAKGVCLPATTFTYNSAAAGTSKFNQVMPSGVGLEDYQGRMRYDPGALLITGDLQGDGLTDFIRMEKADWAANYAGNFSQYLSKGDGTFAPYEYTGWDYTTAIHGDYLDFIPFDYNGDGRTDFIRREKNGWDADAYNNFAVYVAKAPSGYNVYYPGTQGSWGDFYQGLLGAAGGTNIIPGDFDGDGRGDFIRQEHSTWADNLPELTFNVFFSTGSNGNFNPVTPTGPSYGSVLRGDQTDLIPGDYNGDGKTDFIRREKNGWDEDINMTFGVYYSKGDGTFDVYYPGQNVAGDIFQDQLRSDLSLFNGNIFPIQSGSYVIPGDFNGDGKTDFIRQQYGVWAINNPTNNFNIYFSTGKNGGFERVTPSGWDYADAMRGDYVQIFPLDYNGDGKTDFIRREMGLWDDDAYNTFAIYISNGDGTFEVTYPGTQGDWYDFYQGGGGSVVTNIIPGDYDGDGKSDFIRQEWDAYDNDAVNNFSVFFANGDDAGDFLKKVENGLGGTVDVAYASLTDSSVYTKGSNGTYPNVDFQGAMYVVKSATIGDVGKPASEAYNYAYYSALMNTEGRGFLGFETIWQSGSTGTSQATYNQAFPVTGTIKQREQLSGGSSHTVTDRTYWAPTSYPGVYAVLPTLEETTHYESSGPNPPSYKTGKAFIYDDYKNVAIVRDYGVYGDPSDDVDSCTVWYNDSYYWRLAFPSYSRTADSCTYSPGVCSCTGIKQKTDRYYGAGQNLSYVYEWDDVTNGWLETAYTYDAFGNPITKSVPGIVNPMTGATAPIIEATTYDPDYQTFPISQSRSSLWLGMNTTFAYDPRFGALAAQTDTNGNTTTTQFDGLGRVAATSATSDTGYVTPIGRYGWGVDAGGKFRSTSERNGWDTDEWRWQREYLDGKGRVIRTESQGTDPAKPVVVKREYDARGEIKKESVPFYLGDAESYTSYTRDWLGRISQIVDPAGSVTNVSYAVNTSTCSRCVLAETTTEAAGTGAQRTSVRFSDVDGHVLRQVDADGRVTSFVYDTLGRQISSTNTAGTTTLTYDSLGRLLTSNSPDRGLTINEYDFRSGWLSKTTDGNNQVTNYTYDPFGRVVQKSVANKRTITFTYDNLAYANSIGRLSSVEVVQAGQAAASSKNAFSYTPDGRIATNAITIDSATYTVSSTYDPQGRLRGFTYPDGATLVRPYNAQGQLAQLSLNGTAVANYLAYNASGQPTSVTYGSGSSSLKTYDSATRLSTAKTTGPGNTKLLDYTYVWDPLHRISSLIDGRDATRTQSFTYSPSGQLTQATGVYGTLNYGYDSAGNLTSKEGNTYTYTNNRVTSGTGFVAAYDAVGNRVTQTRGSNAWIYQYDGENRIETVKKNGAVVDQFAYDFTGERIKKVDANGTKTLYVTQNFEVTFLPDGRRLETKYVNDASGRVASFTTQFSAPAAALLDLRGLDSTKELFDKHSVAGLIGYAKNRIELLRAEPWAPDLGKAILALGLLLVSTQLARRRFPEKLGQVAKSIKNVLLPPETAFTRRHPFFALVVPLVLVSFLSACGRVPGENVGYTEDELTAGANGEGYPVAGTHYFHNNHLSSSSVVTNEVGVELARTEYKPYGEIVQAASPGLDIFRSKFTGKEWDKDSELYYYNARYYDPLTGRFMSADTQLAGGAERETAAYNPYAYANNNPIVYSDPSGHFFFLVILVAVLVGAYAGGMSTNGTWNPTAWNWNSWQTYMGIGVGGIVGGFSAGLGAGVGGFGGAMLTTTLDSVVLNGLRFLSPQGSTLENFAIGMAMDLAAGAVMAKAMQLWKARSAAKAAEEAAQEGAKSAVKAVRPKLVRQMLEAAGDIGKGIWKVSKKAGTNELRQRYWETPNAGGPSPRENPTPAPQRADGNTIATLLRDMADATLSAAGAGDTSGRIWNTPQNQQGPSRPTKQAPQLHAGFAVVH